MAVIGIWRARLRTARDFALYVWERFNADNCLGHAATLSYTALLSIVPLMTVAFAVIAAFPVFEPIDDRIRSFLFANLVPASGEVVQRYLEGFADKAAGLTAFGIVGLLVSALLMMAAVDNALNQIWHVPQSRSLLQGFMIYWTLLTLGPLLIGASLGVTSYVESMAALSRFGLPVSRPMLLGLVPPLVEFLALLFMYAAVPNRRVPLAHAAAGALAVAVLFELAKKGFAWYVTSFPTYQAIYGALSVLPVFLLWLYLCWIMVLLGAEFTAALSGFGVGQAGAAADPRLRLVLAVRLLGHLWQAQRHGRAISREGLARREPGAGHDAIADCLRALERSKVVLRTDRGRWALARDLDHYTLLDLYRSQAFVLPAPDPLFGERDRWDARLAALLREANDGVDRALAVPLRALFADAERQAASKQGEEA